MQKTHWSRHWGEWLVRRRVATWVRTPVEPARHAHRLRAHAPCHACLSPSPPLRVMHASRSPTNAEAISKAIALCPTGFRAKSFNVQSRCDGSPSQCHRTTCSLGGRSAPSSSSFSSSSSSFFSSSSTTRRSSPPPRRSSPRATFSSAASSAYTTLEFALALCRCLLCRFTKMCASSRCFLASSQHTG